MIITFNVVLLNTLEGSWVEKKRQHFASNRSTFLSVHLGERCSFPELPTCQFLMQAKNLYQKCVEFSSELNGTSGRSP